ncbi:hypothetical protein [Persicirhabdus sediminis]|uniref:OmpL-like beta-barrel porin-2 n=1 Tax=Persicirhabdus sediminis TaxID=454144 RepID=A0A8J7MIZ8_9BACT|nr:hypothetical protein [Persicirhabdus sediminis]MBK1791863.1 hypothetical protein [Persicirhabdus sediminis]
MQKTLFTLGLIAACSAAQAQEKTNQAEKPDVVIMAGIGGGYFNYNITNNFGTTITDSLGNYLGSTNDGGEAEGWGFDGNVYMEFHNATVNLNNSYFTTPAWLTVNAGYQSFSSKGSARKTIDNSTLNGYMGFVAVQPIDGSSPSYAVDILYQESQEISHKYTTDYSRFYGEIGLSARAENNHQWGLSLYLSSYDSKLSSNINGSHELIQGYGSSLDESLDGYSIGPSLNWKHYYEINDKWAVDSAINLAALYTSADMKASQNSYEDAGTMQNFTTTDSTYDFAFLAEYKVSVVYAVNERFELGAQAGIRVRNDMYEFNNPTSSDGQNIYDTSSYPGNSAKLKQTYMVNPFVGFSANFTF